MRGGEAGDNLWWHRGWGGVEMVSQTPSLPLPPGTHHLKLLVRIEAGLSSRREVAENPERVPRTALVGVNPVLPCGRARWVSERGQDSTGFLPTRPGKDLTIRQVWVVAVQLTAHEARALSRARGAPHLLQLKAQRRE